ncbi:hypothetical protein BDV3_001947 [Batrachochytrium dendrobatidis]|nr:hypothetical protein O5D80_007388 [Batrachochytrium dendrobatidis]KAK5664984.1 hypothetical protein QVD99_008519 [Batrachochytrium dendrobatidis]
MTNNSTQLHGIIKTTSLTSWNGILRLVFASLMALMLIPAIPLFILERKQPMVKYRTWTINIVACISATLCMLFGGLEAMDSWVSHETVYYLNFWSNILYTIVVCGFLPTYLRHYFLLRLPVLQQEMLNNQLRFDPAQHTQFSKDLIRTKFFSSEKGAWTIFAINGIPCMFMTIYFALKSGFITELEEPQSPISMYMGIMPLVQIIVSEAFLLWYGPRSPKDNYQIMTQFYVITGLSLANVAVSLVTTLWTNEVLLRIGDAVVSILTFLPISIDIILPLQFLITSHKYVTLSTNLHKRSFGDHLSSPMSLSKERYIGQEMIRTAQVTSGKGSTSYGSPLKPGAFKISTASSSLQQILEDPVIYPVFCLFLSREFSMESLLFIEAIKKFKIHINNNPSISLIKSLYKRIIYEFIQSNAVNEVNLPKRIILRIDASLESVLNGAIAIRNAANIFDEASEHIMEMLALNHLRKFLSSTLYKESCCSSRLYRS